MPDVLELRPVRGDGSLGDVLGTLTRYDDGDVDYAGTTALEGIVDSVLLRNPGYDDEDAFDVLVDGWSNGQLAITQPGAAATESASPALARWLEHLAGLHDQKSHGRRFHIPGDKRSGILPSTADLRRLAEKQGISVPKRARRADIAKLVDDHSRASSVKVAERHADALSAGIGRKPGGDASDLNPQQREIADGLDAARRDVFIADSRHHNTRQAAAKATQARVAALPDEQRRVLYGLDASRQARLLDEFEQHNADRANRQALQQRIEVLPAAQQRALAGLDPARRDKLLGEFEQHNLDRAARAERQAQMAKERPEGRPSGLPAKPTSGDFEDLASRASMKRTPAEVAEMLADLNGSELTRLARKFAGGAILLPNSQTRAGASRGVALPEGMSTAERRQWLAEQIIEGRKRASVWR